MKQEGKSYERHKKSFSSRIRLTRRVDKVEKVPLPKRDNSVVTSRKGATWVLARYSDSKYVECCVWQVLPVLFFIGNGMQT